MADQFYSARYHQSDPLLCMISIDNPSKNRYDNILAPDRTRVPIEGSYINANYIDLGQSKRMIATQGPMENTGFDFWTMVLSEPITKILMLTAIVESGVEKCHKYWPDHGSQGFVNEAGARITVKSIGRELRGPMEITKLLVTHPSDAREKIVDHIYHHQWADHQDTSIEWVITLIDEVVDLTHPTEEMFVCHCSAGVGRTGVIAASIRAIMSAETAIDAMKAIRIQRHGMVQSVRQYRLLEWVIARIKMEKNISQ